MAHGRIRTAVLWLLLVCIGPHVVAGFHLSLLWKAGRGARRTLRPSTVRVDVRSSPIMERDVVMEEEDEQASGAVLIEDVEDFLVDMGASVDVAQDEGDQEEEDVTSILEERLRQFGALTEDGKVDISSRTLKALQSAQEGGRAVIAKASDSVRSFGAYAVSRAVADTELVLRVGVVVASEISSRITPMLLPSARASEPSPGEVKLTFKEKIELAALGIYQPPTQSQFLLRSFSSAGDKEALINDRYQRLQRGKGLAVPERLGALRIPLKIAAGLPALPVGLLKTANKVYELGKEASDRSASRQVIKAFKSLPVLSATSSLDKLLMPQTSATKKGWNLLSPGAEESLQSMEGDEASQAAGVEGRGHSGEQEEEEMWGGLDEEGMEAVMRGAVRGGADGPRVGGWGRGEARRIQAQGPPVVMAAGAASPSMAWPVDEAFMREAFEAEDEEEEEEAEEEEDWVPTATVVKLSKLEEGQADGHSQPQRARGRSRAAAKDAPLWRSGGGGLEVYGAEDDVIDTQVEAVSEGKGKGAEEPLAVVVLLKMVDVVLLGMEKVVLEVLPRAVGTLVMASRRVQEVMTGPTGKRGWELLSAFDKPMRSQTGSS